MNVLRELASRLEVTPRLAGSAALIAFLIIGVFYLVALGQIDVPFLYGAGG